MYIVDNKLFMPLTPAWLVFMTPRQRGSLRLQLRLALITLFTNVYNNHNVNFNFICSHFQMSRVQSLSKEKTEKIAETTNFDKVSLADIFICS